MQRIPVLLLALSMAISATSGFQFMKNWKLPSRNRNAKILKNRFGDKRIAVITSVESELGKETAQALLKTGEYHVIGGFCGNEKGDLNADLSNAADFTPVQCNLDSFQSVREFCDKVNEFRLTKPLDRVVCYAGEAKDAHDQQLLSEDGQNLILQRNYLSPFLLTGLLLDGMEDCPDGRLTLVCNDNAASTTELLDLEELLDTKIDATKSLQNAQQCTQLLTHFLHEKYQKLMQVSFNDYKLGTAKPDQDAKALLEVLEGPKKSGVCWTFAEDKLAETEDALAAYDIDTAYKLFELSEEVTKSQWPSIKVVNSPCPTLKVVGQVTKGQVKKQELKRMRELGRPGISEPDLPAKLGKRQKVAAFADKVVSGVLKNTVGRVARVASSKILGEFPEEALTGSFDSLTEEDVAELEGEITAQLAKENAAQKIGDKKLAVITGCSSGLGRKTALALLRSGEYHVIGAVRDLDKMEAVAEIDEFDRDSFTPMHCELNSFESVRQFCEQVETLRGDKPLDRLICNAGVYQPSLRQAKWSKDGHEQTMQINFLSQFLMISLLMNSMKGSEDPRITMVGSVTGNDNTVGGGGVYPIADLHELDGLKAGFKNPIEMADGYGFIGAKAYKDSKLCLMMLANFLHSKYHKSTGIAFSSMYPGCIAESPLFREKRAWFRKYFPVFMRFITGGFVGEQEAGQRLYQVMHDPRCKKSGVYWGWNGGPREGRGAEALEKGGQISGGGGAGGGWDSIFENDQSGKVLNLDTAYNLFKYSSEITGAEWPSSLEDWSAPPPPPPVAETEDAVVSQV